MAVSMEGLGYVEQIRSNLMLCVWAKGKKEIRKCFDFHTSAKKNP